MGKEKTAEIREIAFVLIAEKTYEWSSGKNGKSVSLGVSFIET